jgi:hypothetical protein
MDALMETVTGWMDAIKNLTRHETHCMDLVSEVMKSTTEHFERKDLHYTGRGMVGEYLCNIDNRTYVVEITIRKQS